MTKPDFFIVGAPKCGTTALHRYLRSHPQVFLPQAKDRCHFGSDLIVGKRLSDIEFEARYADWNGEKRIGESCVHYLYSTSAPSEIRAYAPDAQIIIMLRNPVDLLYSWHSQLLYLGTEDISDFESALAAEPARRAGERIPDPSRVRNSLFYSDVARLSEHVTRYHEVFGRDRVHTILLEDFSKATQETYRATLEFLRLDPQVHSDLPVVNANKKPRNRWLHDVMIREGTLKVIARSVLPRAETRRRLLKPLQRWNKMYTPRRPMDNALRTRLNQEYQAEIQRLSEVLHRDLTHWVRA